ncbi:MAG: disulfide bond formation protein DsbA [Caulobacter sp.]|nr:disulfide bond formation protein DsbA [Caulobacter sp.]
MGSNRRTLIFGAAAATAALAAHAQAATKAAGHKAAPKKTPAKGPVAAQGLPDDMVLGKANAPVTVVEYASASCPHCAHWALNDFPAFKAKYIDTGVVRFVFREFLTEPVSLAVAGFLVARRAGAARYFGVLHDVFAAQPEFYNPDAAEKPIDILHRIGRDAGLGDADVDACLRDQAAINALYARVDRFSKASGVNSTPTFVVGQTKIQGENATPQIEAAIAEALKGPKATPKKAPAKRKAGGHR